ncbi:MAG TPA: MMPL family transporter, partial [Actinomycetaceae bacterium]|nr:MMPL family transporter [Actinomycetaceae bacterium]
MWTALTHRILRRPGLVIGGWALIVVVSLAVAFGVTGTGLFERMHSGQPQIPGSESHEGMELLADDDDSTRVTLALSGIDVDDPEIAEDVGAALAPLRQEVAALPGVTVVLDPFVVPDGLADPAVAALVAQDRQGFLVIVELEPAETPAEADAQRRAVEGELGRMPAQIAQVSPGASGLVSSTALLTSAVVDQLQADLIRGEAIALPLSLAVMVVVFGGFLAAGLPLIGAVASIGAGMGMLVALTEVLTVDS